LAAVSFFYLTDFTLPLLSQQKNGIIGITNIFNEDRLYGRIRPFRL
jgi:hypothetical protein